MRVDEPPPVDVPPPPGQGVALLMGGSGIGDLASVINTGSAFDQAIAGGSGIGGPIGYHDLAWIFGTGSTAIAGSDLTTAGNFDDAVVFGDLLNAMATGKDFLIELLPSLF